MAVMRLLRNAGSGDVGTPPELSFRCADYLKYLTTYFDTFSKFVPLQFLCGAFSGPQHALKTLHNCQSWHNKSYTLLGSFRVGVFSRLHPPSLNPVKSGELVYRTEIYQKPKGQEANPHRKSALFIKLRDHFLM